MKEIELSDVYARYIMLCVLLEHTPTEIGFNEFCKELESKGFIIIPQIEQKHPYNQLSNIY